MTQEALKLALEALEEAWYHVGTFQPTEKAIDLYDEARTAIKEALAQTQEPVPPPWWPAVENILNEYGLQAIDFVADFKQALAQKREPIAMLFGSLPVYDDTTPPQRTWVGLTDKEITALLMPFPKYPSEWDDPDFYRLTQAIEAKLKEKNT